MRSVVIVILLAAGCASSGPMFAQMDADQLLAYGMERLESRKWDEATRALEQFIFQFPTHARYQDARFRLGDAYYGKKEYLTAAAEYARLADDFPQGPLADDARWKVCDSYYLLSPRAQLHQEYTRTAILHCESLIAYYPESEFVPTARERVTELYGKLADKVYLGGEFYFKRGAYDSAIIYYNDVVELFPATEAAPRALLRLYETYRTLQYAEEANAVRDRLLRDYPDSDAARAVRQAVHAPAP